jgi:hypothetical protein
MAINRRDRIKSAQIEEFERALIHAHEDLWWRRFIELVKERRQGYTESLVVGDMDQRSEDRCRGQISELTFILSLDLYGEHHNAERTERSTER